MQLTRPRFLLLSQWKAVPATAEHGYLDSIWPLGEGHVTPGAWKQLEMKEGGVRGVVPQEGLGPRQRAGCCFLAALGARIFCKKPAIRIFIPHHPGSSVWASETRKPAGGQTKRSLGWVQPGLTIYSL